jgi:AcrR family transcriptional regulator
MPTLRERKLARSRLALLDAFVAQLDQRPLEAVNVKELCATVELSEATFFNLFDGKASLVILFIQLWSLEMAAGARGVLAKQGALSAIASIFATTATSVAAHPRVMAEVLAAQARREGPAPLVDLSPALRQLRFPDAPALWDAPAEGLDSLLPWLIGEAVARGELPADVDRDFLFLHLASLFFGTPITLRAIDPAMVGPAWAAQLAMTWRAFGATR